MKKRWLLPLLLLLLALLCATASAANISGQQSIAYVTDSAGQVTSLTDDDASTAWTRSGSGDVDLTLNLYGGSVGEIWIRSGYAGNQNWYYHYDRPEVIKVTIHYYANQHTTSYDSYRYRLVDAFRTYSSSDDWREGYQRLLLPKKYSGVTKVELTIESTIAGYGSTGATISDIILATGRHATATPRAYATATPRPYVVYVTPTPSPVPEEDDLVVFITPGTGAEAIVPGDDAGDDDDDAVTVIRPSEPTEPLVELITPGNTPAGSGYRPTDYPSLGGVIATLTKRAATRSGPGTRYDEPGSFYTAGDEVKVITKVYDSSSDKIWYQIELKYDAQWYRVYTGSDRVDVNVNHVPDEPNVNDPLDTQPTLRNVNAAFGPGNAYALYSRSIIPEGTSCKIFAIENGWVQVEYLTPEGILRRGWVPLDAIYK